MELIKSTRTFSFHLLLNNYSLYLSVEFLDVVRVFLVGAGEVVQGVFPRLLQLLESLLKIQVTVLLADQLTFNFALVSEQFLIPVCSQLYLGSELN